MQHTTARISMTEGMDMHVITTVHAVRGASSILKEFWLSAIYHISPKNSIRSEGDSMRSPLLLSTFLKNAVHAQADIDTESLCRRRRSLLSHAG
jgi:hypothetical protein